MLVLTFEVDGSPFAVPVAKVVEVVPRVALRAVPHAPDCFLGLLRYRGGAVPVVDLGLLMGRAACQDRLDTRILLARRAGAGAGDLLGLLAERVNELVEVDPDRTAMGATILLDAPYLGPVFETASGLLQLIDPGRIAVAGAAEVARAIEP